MFTPIKTRIEDVLNAPARYAIPIYQRDYKWGKEEALELMEDLKNYQGVAGEKLFLGNFIFETTKSKHTSVVDGQQRLTTIILLLVACRERALKLGEIKLAQAIQGKITFIDSTTGESQGGRLVASDSILEIFEHITKDSWDGTFPRIIGKKQVKRQTNKIRPIYDFFLGEVSALTKDALSNFLRAIYDAFVIRIDIESEVDALSIFERTNARGMELAISDLLKNYLFREKVEKVEKVWDNILENSSGTILRMLKYFYIAKRGHVLKPQLYKKLKGYAAEESAQQLTDDLFAFSEFYRMTKSRDEKETKEYFRELNCTAISSYEDRYQRINIALQSLQEFGITQYCPPAFAALECLIRNDGANKVSHAKALIRLFEAFEKYHFINNVVCERVGNEVEKLYAEASQLFTKSNDFVKTTDIFINDLARKLATESEFIANFCEFNYANENISIIAYIFDRFNNYNLDPGQRTPIFNPDPAILRRNHNIEHFLPQKPKSELKVTPDTLDVVNNIGNLLAVYFKTNSRLGNESPAKKIELLCGKLKKEVQNLSYVQDFIEKYKNDASAWNKAKIEKRARDMAENGYRVIWKI